MASQMQFLLLVFVTVAVWSHTGALLTDYCLRCICEQSNECDCSDEDGCGPFNIERTFMSAASDSDTGRRSFEDCAADVGCSRRVFQAYVDSYTPPRKYRRVSQCELAARLQNGGARGPTSRLTDEFWLMVQSCMIN